MNKFNPLAVGVPIIAITGLVVLLRHGGLASEHQMPHVTVAKVETASAQSDIVAEGTIVPGKTVSVALLPGISGQVTKVYADIGSRVTKGQLLAEIDSSAVQDSYGAAVANARSLAQQYALVLHPYLPEQIDQQRVKVLTDRQSVIEAQNNLALLVKGSRHQQVDADTSNVDAAQAQSDVANAALEREKTLYASDLVPKAEMEAAETAARVAGDSLNSAQQVLSLAKEGNLPQQISSAQAAATAAKLTYRSDSDALRLMLEGSRPEQIAQAAENSRVAQLNASAQSVALSHQFVYAPTDGVVIARNVNPGELVVSASSPTDLASPLSGTGKGLFTIADNSTVVFQANIDQMYTHAVTPGQQATVGVEASPGNTFPARLIAVNPLVYQAAQEQAPAQTPASVSPSTPLTFSARAQVYDPSRKLAPGEQGVLTIHQKNTGLVVPSAAVTSYTVGEGVVYVLKGDTVKAQVIHYSGNLDKDIRVISGLKSGEEVVVSDTSQLKSDMQVQADLVSSN